MGDVGVLHNGADSLRFFKWCYNTLELKEIDDEDTIADVMADIENHLKKRLKFQDESKIRLSNFDFDEVDPHLIFDDDCELIQFSRSKLIVLINFKQEKKIFLYEDEQLKSLSDSETSIKDFDVCEDSIVTCDGRLLKLWKVVDNQLNQVGQFISESTIVCVRFLSRNFIVYGNTIGSISVIKCSPSCFVI